MEAHLKECAGAPADLAEANELTPTRANDDFPGRGRTEASKTQHIVFCQRRECAHLLSGEGARLGNTELVKGMLPQLSHPAVGLYDIVSGELMSRGQRKIEAKQILVDQHSCAA